MEGIPLLRDIVILFAASIIVLVIFHRIGLPTIIGFLVTGILIGPYGLRLVTNVESVELLAQIGIVLLLFTIGMELSIASIKRVGREVIGVGSFQIIFTAALVVIIANLLNISLPVSILLGFVIAHSSTAIILKILDDRGEIDSPHGRLALSICIVQDLSVIPMVIILQGLGGTQDATLTYIVKTLLYAVLSIILVLLLSYILAPRLIHQVVKLRSREVFILTILFVCLGIAWFTSRLGLPIALGAFIAGIVISESEYSHQITAEILPFKDVFTSLFFISIGMLLELNYFISNIHKILPISVGIIVFKTFIIVAAGQILRYPLRMIIIVGLGLSNIGEFSFLLMKIGETYGLMSKDLYQTLLASSIVTMAVTPFLFQKSQEIALSIANIFRIRESKLSEPSRKTTLTDHVIIVGYGLNGQNLARVLKDGGIHYIVMDIDINRIRKAKKEGHRAIFGDASHPEVMKKVGIGNARMVVVAISDPVTTRRTVRISRDINSSVYIIVRTRYTEEVQELYKLGANQVIAEEFETSIEIFARVLREYHIPQNVIQNQIELVRQQGYAMLRTPSIARDRIMELSSILAATISDTFFVQEGSYAVNKTLSQMEFRKRTGVSIIAVIRRQRAKANPPPDFMIEAGDILVMLGSHAEMESAVNLLKGGI
ncbi:MAG: cation:proton antiporter [Deltaproteobacteria bacterium]|nr:cation:proton antiporter [Deltaproteobacteria bacterium]